MLGGNSDYTYECDYDCENDIVLQSDKKRSKTPSKSRLPPNDAKGKSLSKNPVKAGPSSAPKRRFVEQTNQFLNSDSESDNNRVSTFINTNKF